MKNPLRTLDELVLTQFEKLTQAAHRGLGWTKYEVGTFFDNAGCVMGTGAGIYETLKSFAGNSFRPEDLVLGVLCLSASGLYAMKAKKHNEKSEQQELDLYLKTGAVQLTFSDSKPLRPVLLTMGGSLMTLAAYYLGVREVEIAPSQYQMKTLTALYLFTLGAANVLLQTSDYIGDTTFIPPGAKKSFLKTAYQSLVNKLRLAPQAEPAPVKEYVGENMLGNRG